MLVQQLEMPFNTRRSCRAVVCSATPLLLALLLASSATGARSTTQGSSGTKQHHSASHEPQPLFMAEQDIAELPALTSTLRRWAGVYAASVTEYLDMFISSCQTRSQRCHLSDFVGTIFIVTSLFSHYGWT